MAAVYVTPIYRDAYIPDISSTDATLKNGTIALRCAVSGVVKVDIGVTNNVTSTGIVIPLAATGPDLVLPITKLYKTGTTATGIVAFI